MSENKFIFRPKTIPINRNKSRSRVTERRDENARQSGAVDRPQDNFFKLVFQRDTYLWVIFHKSIKKIEVEKMVNLFNKMNDSYSNLQLDQNNLPICTEIEEVNKWLQQYQCKIALDQSVIDYYDEILAHPNCILAKVVTEANIEVVRKIRKSKFGYKVRSVDDAYDNIITSVKEDMEKIKILKENEQLEKVRLPNFMKLKLKDKADLITYRSNIYCLASLHKNKIDMETSKKRFIQQCQKIYSSQKDKQFMKYYLTYPFNDKEILRFYTEDSFFYKCMNNTLRMAKNTEEFYIIGQPFNQMFHAIKNIYLEQFPYTQSRKDLKLYRGADLSETECKYLESCIGNYIEIHGFVSTTMDLAVAQKFAKDRKHNKILQIVFEDIVDRNAPAIKNDYGFVNLADISRFEENQILFNTLNIFKVMGKQQRDGYEFFTLKYGTIFNILNKKNPELLKKDDRLAYYTYKELMGQKDNLQDLGQVFLKNHQTQKSVDYYQSKIIEAKSQNRSSEVVDLIIKKSQALILNGQPAKALESMMILLSQRKNIKHTSSGARFLQSILSDKEEIIKEIDITKKYSQAGHSLDKFDEAQTQLTDTNQALEDALKTRDNWDFDIAFGQLQVLMQLAHLKQSLQNYKEMFAVLNEAQALVNEILNKMKENDVSFHNRKQVYLQKTLIYELMAKNSEFLEGDQQISIEQLQIKYDQTERELVSLIEQKSYDKSLIEIRRIEIKRRRQDFNKNKERFINKLQQSLVSIKQTSTQDSQIPKVYHMLAEIQKSSKTVTSTNTAIGYLQKQFVTQSHYYGQNDPRPMQTVIDIAQCHRNIKDSQESIDILRQQIKIVPFKNKPNHTIVTKTLYTMGLAYLDIGQFSYALKCFEKGLNMLHQVLSKKQIQKYPHRYKIQLQLGRTFTFLSRYSQAEQKLFSYHNFIVKLYENHHSDVANSLNHFAILYLKMKQHERARQKFEQSADMFRLTSGEKALVVAKIKCNLGMVYSILKNQQLALKNIDQARFLFNQIYSSKESVYNDDQLVHTQTAMILFYYAQIYKMFKNFKEALQYYIESKQKFERYKLRKRRQKDLKGASFISQFNSYNPLTRIFNEGKKDNHQLICRVKIIECQAKLKDFTFWEDLQQVIKQLQKQTLQYNEMQNSKISEKSDKVLDKGCVSQLNNLLTYCNGLYKHYQINKEKYAKKSKKGKKSKKQEKNIDGQNAKEQIEGQQKIDKTHINNQNEQIKQTQNKMRNVGENKEQLEAVTHHGQEIADPMPENIGQTLLISNIKNI